MRKQNIFFSIGMILFLLFAQQSNAQFKPEDDLKALQKIIEENNSTYFNAIAKNDSLLFTSLYTFDCWIMAPGAPTYCGPDAAGDYFSYACKRIKGGKFIPINLYGITEDIIAETGFYQLLGAGNTQLDDGKYIVLWKKTGNTWKRFRDSFSSNQKNNNKTY